MHSLENAEKRRWTLRLEELLTQSAELAGIVNDWEVPVE